MKIVYASRSGNVEKLVKKLGVDDIFKIVDGTEEVDDSFILITYNDGEGEIPAVVKNFLDNNAFLCSGVFTSGNALNHPYTYNFAAQKIEEEYGLEILGKFDDDGDSDTVDDVLDAIERLS